MSTSSLSRRSGPRRGAGALVTLAVAGTALLGAPAAVAAPGDNGDVKVHDSGTGVDDPREDPKVCHFYLDGFNFDPGQQVTWFIVTQPLVAGGANLRGSLDLPSGHARTPELTLPDGQYKLTWRFVGENGAGKSKVFRVDCPIGIPTSSPSASPTGPGGGPGGSTGGPGGPGGGPGGPNGGPPAGGGGMAHPQDFSPVAGAAAVGLVVAGGVVFLRLRRRPDGAA
ncbi:MULTISPECIES: hypothetical protein [unclassified Streptomyces]|uniref:hypothetical protein n=1 Tax=unclassified Streptomyces TaxID=2593676 RepID=UPI002251AFF8|nr:MULTISPECIES: hypothetical protein [unclassified Streptomyces]MCX4992009.1 hypothetical protein [Streptomyces sp. NBC_00568]MCX5002755.1 hypothetical protein [Streptomyces sp. NBC_00638]